MSDARLLHTQCRQSIAEALTDLGAIVHRIARSKGWWDTDRNQGELIALIHSELSEALEALRHGNPASDHIPEVSAVAEEMADVVIRVADYCESQGIDLGKAIALKVAFNEGRPHRHGGKAF